MVPPLSWQGITYAQHEGDQAMLIEPGGIAVTTLVPAGTAFLFLSHW
jgi:hypothetical protein